MTKVDAACTQAPFGKLMPTALYVHTEGLNRLSGILRVLREGCARVLSGAVEGTTIIKLRRHEPKISYLGYPGFDDDAHPHLTKSVRVDLRSLHLKYRDFTESPDPPILHRKEEFVPEDYPNERTVRRPDYCRGAGGAVLEPGEHSFATRPMAENLAFPSGPCLWA